MVYAISLMPDLLLHISLFADLGLWRIPVSYISKYHKSGEIMKSTVLVIHPIVLRRVVKSRYTFAQPVALSRRKQARKSSRLSVCKLATDTAVDREVSRGQIKNHWEAQTFATPGLRGRNKSFSFHVSE